MFGVRGLVTALLQGDLSPLSKRWRAKKEFSLDFGELGSGALLQNGGVDFRIAQDRDQSGGAARALGSAADVHREPAGGLHPVRYPSAHRRPHQGARAPGRHRATGFGCHSGRGRVGGGDATGASASLGRCSHGSWMGHGSHACRKPRLRLVPALRQRPQPRLQCARMAGLSRSHVR